MLLSFEVYILGSEIIKNFSHSFWLFFFGLTDYWNRSFIGQHLTGINPDEVFSPFLLNIFLFLFPVQYNMQVKQM